MRASFGCRNGSLAGRGRQGSLIGERQSDY